MTHSGGYTSVSRSQKRKQNPFHSLHDKIAMIGAEVSAVRRFLFAGQAARWKALVTCDAQLRFAVLEYEAGRIGVNRYIRALEAIEARVP